MKEDVLGVFAHMTLLVPSLRLRTRMRLHMPSQVAGRRESLAARLADMRPLPRKEGRRQLPGRVVHP